MIYEPDMYMTGEINSSLIASSKVQMYVMCLNCSLNSVGLQPFLKHPTKRFSSREGSRVKMAITTQIHIKTQSSKRPMCYEITSIVIDEGRGCDDGME